MRQKFPLVKVIAITSSLMLVALFVLYRGGVIQFHRGPAAAPPTSSQNQDEPTAPTPNENAPEFFHGSKSGPIVTPETSNERIMDITSKSGRIVKPDDVRDPEADAQPATGDETP